MDWMDSFPDLPKASRSVRERVRRANPRGVALPLPLARSSRWGLLAWLERNRAHGLIRVNQVGYQARVRPNPWADPRVHYPRHRAAEPLGALCDRSNCNVQPPHIHPA